jgi:hypothetical protein
VASAFALAGSAWLAAGVRVLDRTAQFAVVTGPWLQDGVGVFKGRRVVVVPPGLFGVTVFSLRPESVPLPDAEHAMLECATGAVSG